MAENIEILVREAEKKWLSVLEKQLDEAFSNVFLPSHDTSHHRRVWEHGKKLLMNLSRHNKLIDASLVEGLLISIYFHDQGMVLTRDRDHGRVSRYMCEKFFKMGSIDPPENLQEILHAIEYHDKKESNHYEAAQIHERPDLLTILSVSDDLDAVGTVGIYRYAEIYLFRGVDIRKLGISILENISIRFNNFLKICMICPELSREYKSAYSEIITFYDKYNQQLLADTEPEHEFNGPIGIVNYIYNFSVKGKIPPSGFLEALENFRVTKFVKDFFIKLDHELAKTS